MFGFRQFCVRLDEFYEWRKQCMIAVCSIKAMVAIGPAGDQTDCCKLAQFVLNRVQSETRFARQLANVVLLRRQGEQKLQYLRPDIWKQHLQNWPF